MIDRRRPSDFLLLNLGISVLESGKKICLFNSMPSAAVSLSSIHQACLLFTSAD
jgi:hypothetical protein